jgi:hypothetical protein
MSTIRKQREPGSHLEESPPEDAACPASPNPVDVLDILQALSYKLENLRSKIRRVEQLEPIPSTMTNTRIVAAIIQMQIDIASLFEG